MCGSDTSTRTASATRSSKSIQLHHAIARAYAALASVASAPAQLCVRFSREMARSSRSALCALSSSVSASSAMRSVSPATRKPGPRPAALQCSRRMARPSEWKVWMATLFRAGGQQACKALAHLAGGAAGEGDGEAALRGGAALGDQMGDAIGEGAGLPRTRARDDQQRSVHDVGCGALILIE